MKPFEIPKTLFKISTLEEIRNHLLFFAWFLKFWHFGGTRFTPEGSDEITDLPVHTGRNSFIIDILISQRHFMSCTHKVDNVIGKSELCCKQFLTQLSAVFLRIKQVQRCIAPVGQVGSDHNSLLVTASLYTQTELTVHSKSLNLKHWEKKQWTLYVLRVWVNCWSERNGL